MERTPESEFPGNSHEQRREELEAGGVDPCGPRPPRPRPWERAPVTFRLLVANVGVFVVMVLLGVSMTAPDPEQLLRFGANFGPATRGGEYWRLLTAVFLHIGIVHLAVNMWALWNLGQLGETLMGRGAFIVLYLLSGLAGSIASQLFNPVVVSAGASGAIFGIVGGLIAFLSGREVGLPVRVVRSMRANMIAIAGINLVIGFSIPGIDNAAHGGGFVGGLLLGLLLRRPFPVPEGYSNRNRVIAVAAGGTAALALLFALSLLRPPEARLRVISAEEHAARGELSGALAEVNRVLAEEPDLAEGHWLRGRILLAQEDAAGALLSLKRAAGIDPENPAVWTDLALAQAMERRLLAARESLEQALALDPGYAPALRLVERLDQGSMAGPRL